MTDTINTASDEQLTALRERLSGETPSTLEELEAAPEQVVTNQTFFGRLRYGTIVRAIGVTSNSEMYQYICDGYFYVTEDADNPSYRLFSVSSGRQNIVTPEQLSQENRWEVMRDESGEAKIAPRNLHRAFANLLEMQNSANEHAERVIAQRDEIASWENDFARFNEMLNEFANSGHYGRMCEVYEEQLGRWNSQLSKMKFLGRPRTFYLEVDVEMRQTITVTAQSEDQAREQVRDMSNRAVLESILSRRDYVNGTVRLVGDDNDSDDDDSDDEF